MSSKWISVEANDGAPLADIADGGIGYVSVTTASASLSRGSETC